MQISQAHILLVSIPPLEIERNYLQFGKASWQEDLAAKASIHLS